ncbi:hypothetical protein Tco_0387852, partial [Tanacetum coccineum]
CDLAQGVGLLVFTSWYLFNGKFREAFCECSYFVQRPAISASYSASLLVASNLNLIAYVNSTPFGFVSIRPAPEPSTQDEPSVNNVHGSGTASG